MCDGKSISNGAVSGTVAGIVFAFFLILRGSTENLASFIGLPDQLNGMIIHFIISILLGIIFALILGWLIHSWWSAIFLGLLFSIVMWIIGPMTLSPSLSTGTSLFSEWNFSGIQANLTRLIGYLIYGLILGLCYCFLKKGKLHKLKKPKA